MEAVKYLHEELDHCSNGVELLSVLNVLFEFIQKNANFRKLVSQSEIIGCLINIISHPQKYLQNVANRHKRRQASSSEPESSAEQDNSEIFSLIRRIAVKVIFLQVDYLGCNKSCIQSLINLLNPTVKHNAKAPQGLFCYSQDFTRIFRDAVGKWRFGSQIKANCVERVDLLSLVSELEAYEPEFVEISSPVILIQIPVWLCQIEIEELDKKSVVVVADALASQGYAWRKDRLQATQTLPLDARKEKTKGDCAMSKTRERRVNVDAVITEVMNGNFFWALMGEEAIEKVSEIDNALMTHETTLRQIPPKVTEVVASRVTTPIGTKIIRCQVLALEEHYAVVFGLDIGGLHYVHERDVFALPLKFNLTAIPPQVSIGRLKGILPTPTDPVVVELAAATLSKMSRDCAIALTQELQILPLLPTLIDCPNLNVAKQALSLAANLLLKIKHDCSNDWQNVLIITLDVMNQVIALFKKEKNGRTQPLAGNGTDQHSSNGGSKSPASKTRSLSPFIGEDQLSNCQAVTYSCFVMMINFIHMNKYAKEYFFHQNGLETVLRAYLLMTSNHHVFRAGIHLLSNFIHVSTKNQLLKNKVFDSRQNKRSQIPLECLTTTDTRVTCQSLEEDCDDDDDEVIDFKTCLSDDVDWDSEDEESSGSSVKDEGEIKFYMKDSVYPFVKDHSYELLPTMNLKPNFLASIICGMLNTGHEGIISLGIATDNLVNGVKMTHDEREGLRGGVKDIMDNQMQPHLLYPQVKIRFVPVVVPDDSQNHVEKIRAVKDFYVVEISCQPIPGMVYSVRNNQSYYRFGYKTGLLTEKDIRHLVVIEEEAQHRETIQKLRAVIKDLRSKEANGLQV